VSETPDDPQALLGRLAAAAEGLVYSSESDRPFETFFLPADRVPEALTPERFAAAAGAAPDEPAEEWTLDRFFLPHIECVEPVDAYAWARLPRYDALKRMLQQQLRGTRVFRVGRVQVRCYAVGRDAAGHLLGLQTVAVET
jgi:hypothetical protein